jgi:hypothetical protein
MTRLFENLTPVAMAAVVVVLLLGLLNMMRRGPSSRSQMLMRWRVGLQFVAVAVMMTSLYLASR